MAACVMEAAVVAAVWFWHVCATKSRFTLNNRRKAKKDGVMKVSSSSASVAPLLASVSVSIHTSKHGTLPSV